MKKVLSRVFSSVVMLSMLVIPLASLPSMAFAAAPGDFPVGDFPSSGYTSLGTDQNENGCKAHRNILESYFKIVPSSNGTDNFVFLRVRTADPAGWPSSNTNGDARYKWFFDTTGGDGGVQGGNIVNYEYLLGVEDPGNNANDGVGEIKFYDLNNVVLGGPTTATGSIAPSGPQTAYTNDFGYKIEGNFVDMYVRLSAIGNPANFKVFWSTDNEDQNIKQASNCDRPDNSDNFISLPTFTLTVNGAGAGNGTVTGTGISCVVNAGLTSGDCTETFVTGTTVSLNQSAATGSDFSGWSGNCDVNGQVVMNGNKTCTATFVIEPPTTGTLIVTKVVTNDSGGAKVASDFSFQINAEPAIAFEADGSNSFEKTAGAYTVTEVAVPGYTTTYSAGCTAGVTVGQTTTCTITNDDIAPKLTLVKTVVNDNDGTKVVADFPLFINGVPAISGTAYDQNANVVLTATETNSFGYSASAWGGDCAANGTITLQPGDNKTCTITNDDQQATLIINKVLPNDNGGTAVATDFSFSVNGGPETAFEADGSNSVTVNAGTYNVVETNPMTGYAVTYSGCSDIVLLPGSVATCTITNDDQPATLTVTKVVVNNSRTNSEVDAFNLFVGTEQVLSGISELFNAGTYVVSETGDTLSAYNTAFSGDCASGSVVLANGDTKTCTITNTAKEPGVLHVIKDVINDEPEGYTGTATAEDFTISVTGGNPTPASFDGSETGTEVIIDAGASFSVEETGGPLSSYGMSMEGTCSGTMPEGGDFTCTITNDDNDPTTGGLTVVKVVKNDNGGTKAVADFPLRVTNASDPLQIINVTSGVNTQFTEGDYVISEEGDPAYTATFSENCASGNVTIVNGESKTCTITNDDIPPSLTLAKNVNIDNGGTAVATDWVLMANGPTSISGAGGATSGPTFIAGTYTLSETGPSGYTAGAWSCAGDIPNQVTIKIGQSINCSITNDDQQGTLIVKKIVVGGDADAEDFSFSINGAEAITFDDDGQNDILKDAGTYSILETANPDYTATYENCTDVTLQNGGTATCTITNTFKTAPPVDVCPNIDGIQTEVPNGKVKDRQGNCVDESSGGGSSSGSRPRSSGGQVLGAATDICSWTTEYLRRNWKGNVVNDVETMQNFLNLHMTSNLVVDKNFGPKTEAEVKAFQSKYMADILTPWGISKPTGIWYISTTTKAKEIMCGEKTPLPPLVNWSQNPAVKK